MRVWRVAVVCVLLASYGCDDLLEAQPNAAGTSPEAGKAPQVVEAKERAEKGAPSLNCYLEAERFLFPELAWELCRSARSTGPVVCYREADRLVSRSKQQNVALCRCAVSAAPVTCFDRARRETMLSDTRIEALCNARVLFGLGDDCLPFCSGGWL